MTNLQFYVPFFICLQKKEMLSTLHKLSFYSYSILVTLWWKPLQFQTVTIL